MQTTLVGMHMASSPEFKLFTHLFTRLSIGTWNSSKYSSIFVENFTTFQIYFSQD